MFCIRGMSEYIMQSYQPLFRNGQKGQKWGTFFIKMGDNIVYAVGLLDIERIAAFMKKTEVTI